MRSTVMLLHCIITLTNIPTTSLSVSLPLIQQQLALASQPLCCCHSQSLHSMPWQHSSSTSASTASTCTPATCWPVSTSCTRCSCPSGSLRPPSQQRQLQRWAGRQTRKWPQLLRKAFQSSVFRGCVYVPTLSMRINAPLQR